MPLVSIIIPIYNVEPYIHQCLQSVMDQTLTEGVECILVNDRGTDHSMEIAQQMVDEYNGNIDFRIIHHEKNRGLSAARNTGILTATGDYLYFLDSDDWILSECIELMIQEVETHPDTQIVFAGTIVSTGEHKWLDYTSKYLPEYSSDRDWLQLSMLKRKEFGMTAWNKLVKRGFIMNHDLLFVEGVIHEDEIWNFQLSSFIQFASFVKQNTYYYNKRVNSLSKNSLCYQIVWENHLKIWEEMKNKITDNNPELQIWAISRYIVSFCLEREYDKKRRLIAKIFAEFSEMTNSLSSTKYRLLQFITYFDVPKPIYSRIVSFIGFV